MNTNSIPSSTKAAMNNNNNKYFYVAPILPSTSVKQAVKLNFTLSPFSDQEVEIYMRENVGQLILLIIYSQVNLLTLSSLSIWILT